MSIQSVMAKPGFIRAQAEIESLGLRISEKQHAGSTPYMVIGGRSNLRWWLIPQASQKLAVSGMALFQPVLASAKIIKGLAIAVFSLGLSSLWARKQLHISGKSCLADFFGDEDIYYAFFTGTDSPHRKAAVQIMDRSGGIKGFAKIAINPAVKPLLAHEAATLRYLHTLDLQFAHIPVVLFNGEQGNARMLVTDTLKTAQTRSAITLNARHLAFLNELAHKTATPAAEGDNWLIQRLRQRYESLENRLSLSWQKRFKQSLERIALGGAALGPPVLTHGDFTPWNTFFVEDKLYVFDWEYASQDYPAGCDLLHFLMSNPDIKRLNATGHITTVLQKLAQLQFAGAEDSSRCLLVTYLCGHALHYASRVPGETDLIKSWDCMEQAADLLDAALTGTTS
jgi:Phosphotransferase enzyme family